MYIYIYTYCYSFTIGEVGSIQVMLNGVVQWFQDTIVLYIARDIAGY